MGLGGQRHAPAVLLPALSCRLSWPQADLEGAENLDPRTVHPVASRYTDYALPAHSPTAEVCIIAMCVLLMLENKKKPREMLIPSFVKVCPLVW